MKPDENDVLSCCSKCMPKPGCSGVLHRLAHEGGRWMCTNPECRHDWTDWDTQPKDQAK